MAPTRRDALRTGALALVGAIGGCTGGDSTTVTGSPTPERQTGTPTTAKPEADVSPTREPPTDTRTERPTTTPTVTTLDVRWQFERPVYLPVVSDGTVVLVSHGVVHAVDAVTGRERWRQEGKWSEVVVEDRTVYAVGREVVSALDFRDGTVRWTHRPQGTIHSRPTVVEDTIYISIMDPPSAHTESDFPEDLFALEASGANVRWKRNLVEVDPIRTKPAVADGTVYVGGRSRVFALDADDGSTLWTTDVGQVEGSPAVADDTVYVTGDGGLYALSATDGRTLWRRGYVHYQPAVWGQTVYVVGRGDRSVVRALATGDGSERWSTWFDGEATTAPVPTGDAVFAGFKREPTSRNRERRSVLYGLQADDGTRETRFEITGAEFRTPAVTGSSVYVGVGGGVDSTYALDRP